MNNKVENNFSIINEGSAKIYIHSTDLNSIPSKSMTVFFNIKMEINRDVSNLAILAYNNLFNKNSLIIVDAMAASGASSIRMLKECNNIKRIYINDKNPLAVELLYKNILLNELGSHSAHIKISKKDANLLLHEIEQKSFLQLNTDNQKPNIISIDPFGAPNLYMDSAFKAIQSHNGLLCITATDTAVLFGIKPKACIRKYLSKPLHNEYCKEIGARILIHFISSIANVNKLGIIPLLTFYTSHFIRVFCITVKDKKKISKLIENYGYIIHCNNCGHRNIITNIISDIFHECPLCHKKKIDYAGPLWIGEIHNEDFIEELSNLIEKTQFRNKKRITKLLNIIKEEISMPISYYNIHKLCQILKIPMIPKLEKLINGIKEKGYACSRTHFDFLSIKTNLNVENIKQYLLKIH